MRIHLIAMGGSIMHNLALALHRQGHEVSGSDDEIYDPARRRLAASGLLPDQMGWSASSISTDLDLIIIGMHARPDNPELVRAQELNISIQSFPEFIYQQSRDKQRVVVAGSHGKTTTTAMILHVLQELKFEFDFLVGAQLEGFDLMVKLSDAPLLIVEGDEYLSSPIDRVPKIWHYHPHISIITGIAWDHMNVFPTFAEYKGAFSQYLETMEPAAHVFCAGEDEILLQMMIESKADIKAEPYFPFESFIERGQTFIKLGGITAPLQIFGRHNLTNLRAAYLVLKELGVSDEQFLLSIQRFTGAAKRQQLLGEREDLVIYQDFAHAPSKVRATVQALADQYPDRQLVACLELHTFSSLNKAFLPHYEGALASADTAIVFVSDHTLEMKRRPQISNEELFDFFGRSDLVICRNRSQLELVLDAQEWFKTNLLLMSSGTFDGLDLSETVKKILS